MSWRLLQSHILQSCLLYGLLSAISLLSYQLTQPIIQGLPYVLLSISVIHLFLAADHGIDELHNLAYWQWLYSNGASLHRLLYQVWSLTFVLIFCPNLILYLILSTFQLLPGILLIPTIIALISISLWYVLITCLLPRQFSARLFLRALLLCPLFMPILLLAYGTIEHMLMIAVDSDIRDFLTIPSLWMQVCLMIFILGVCLWSSPVLLRSSTEIDSGNE